jgi:hypothetical protein
MNTEDIKQAYKTKGYRFFTQPDSMNIFGVRSKNSESTKFDDYVGFIVQCATEGVEVFRLYPATTDPGKSWLLSPMMAEGTAIMIPGQYPGLYKIGRHKDYEALEQVNSAEYVRDNNRDSKLNFDLYRDKLLRAANSFRANLKTNIHRASSWRIINVIGLYSAGCQVIQNPDNFQELLEYCAAQVAMGWGNKFTYTLFEESEIHGT